MNRFLSKLDLRDIKIDPRGSRFPPDEASYARQDESADLPHRAESVDAFQPADAFLASAQAAIVEEAVQPAETQPDPLESVSTPETHQNGDVIHSGEVLKVSARSRPSAVAGAIAGVVREAGRAEVQAIGAGATNQAVKAVAIARDYLRETGIDAVCLPAFIDVMIDNEDRTAIRLVIEPR